MIAKLRKERLERQKLRAKEEFKRKMRQERIKKEAEAEARREIMDEDAEMKLREAENKSSLLQLN
jgi:hypothetical protein